MRREIARISLERLIQDGRIHPARIEETVEKARKEVEQRIRQEGERAVMETNVNGLNHELVRLIGRLRYRTSYRQNVLNHSIEVAHLAGIMASELGVDAALARRAGLLHDIGRYAGVSSERHLIDGYRFCMERGWKKAGQICISHAFMIQDIHTSIGTFDVSKEDFRFMEKFIQTAVYDDYDRLVQLCDALALPTGFCLLEKRFVDVTLRYGVHPATIDRWKKTLELKNLFEKRIGGSVYTLLPGVLENSFSLEVTV